MIENTSSKKVQVRDMFNNIAHRYDFLNHFLSFGIDYYWRKKVFSLANKLHPEEIIDIATGTGDLAIALAKTKPKKIIGIDISTSMLKIGNEKIQRKKLTNLIDLQLGDSEKLSFKDNTFDLATVAFGVRNFENLTKGLSEILRVLKPNSTLIILEFSHPKSFPIKQLYGFYSFRILPLIGKIISNDSSAYTYLPESVSKFPCFEELTEILENCGFVEVKFKSLTGGISTIYTAKKKILS